MPTESRRTTNKLVPCGMVRYTARFFLGASTARKILSLWLACNARPTVWLTCLCLATSSITGGEFQSLVCIWVYFVPGAHHQFCVSPRDETVWLIIWTWFQFPTIRLYQQSVSLSTPSALFARAPQNPFLTWLFDLVLGFRIASWHLKLVSFSVPPLFYPSWLTKWFSNKWFCLQTTNLFSILSTATNRR